MPQPIKPALHEPNLFSDIRALLEEHHANLVTHIESCVSSAVSRSLQVGETVQQPGFKPTTMRSVSSLSSLAMSENSRDQDAPKVQTNHTSRSYRPRGGFVKKVDTMTMKEADERARQAALILATKEDTDFMLTMSQKEMDYGEVHWFRARLKDLVELRTFEVSCALLILANSVMIGAEIQTQLDDPTNDRSAFFVVAQCIFCLFFFSELMVRLIAEGLVHFFLHSEHLTWNYLDVFIVSCMIVEVALQLTLTFASVDTGASKGMRGVGNVRLLRVLRVFRLIRTLRMVRVIRFVRSLRLLMNSIMSTLHALGWSMMLLMMIIYVFAIVFTQEASDYLLDKDPYKTATGGHIAQVRLFFGSLPESMFTLFKAISNGVSWHEPVEALDEISFLCVALFAVFVAFVYFAVLNVVTGVFCTSAIESSLRDHENAVHAQIKNKKRWQKTMETLFRSIDTDGSKFINIHEFEEGLSRPQVKAYMQSMELDPDDAWTLFKLLDTDATQSVDVEEFVLGCLRLRGPARSLDVAKLIYDTRMMSKRQELFMDYVESQLSRLAIYSHYTAAQVRSQTKSGVACVKDAHDNLPPVLASDELQRSRLRSHAVSGPRPLDRGLNPNQLDGDMYGVLSATSNEYGALSATSNQYAALSAKSSPADLCARSDPAESSTKARVAPALAQPQG